MQDRHILSVPPQILSLTDSNKLPLLVEMNSAVKAMNHGLQISPNNQSSQLGDRIIILESCGEIDISLYRNDHELKIWAIVVRSLHFQAIGGTSFIKDNTMKQDFINLTKNNLT